MNNIEEMVIIKNLGLIKNYIDKERALGKIEVKDDEMRLNIAKYAKDDYIAYDYIVQMEDERNKIKAIEFLGDTYKAKLINTLSSDDVKIEQLNKIKNESAKVYVIRNLQDYNKKIEQMEKLRDELHKAEVICKLKDDDKKIEQLSKLNNELFKAKVISTLQDDNIKIEQMEKINDESFKALIMCTLQNDFSKADQLIKLSNEPSKVVVICSMENEIIQMDYLNGIRDNFLKAVAIESVNMKNNEHFLFERDNLKKIFLKNNIKYNKIGLDKNITIGMEIESEGIMSEIIENLGIVISEKRNEERKFWNAERDISLKAGVEVKSPILTDNTEDIEDVYIICLMLQRLGQKINETCGGHIHIGSDYLKSKEAYVNLFEIWGNAEKIICKMSNEKGSIPRMGLQHYAGPISPKLNNAIERGTVNLESEEDLDKFISEVQKVQKDRYSGLNLLNINHGMNTVEFRIPNGTINPDTWIENARLFGKIIQISQKLAEIEKKPEQTEEEKRLLNLKSSLKENISEQEKVEKLLELLFPEEEKQVYIERYESSSKLLENIPDEKNPFKKTEFSRVDFKKKKSQQISNDFEER